MHLFKSSAFFGVASMLLTSGGVVASVIGDLALEPALDNARVYVNALGEVTDPWRLIWGGPAVKELGVGSSKSSVAHSNGVLSKRQDYCPYGYSITCPDSYGNRCCPTSSPTCCAAGSGQCCGADQFCQGTVTCCNNGQVGCGEACCNTGETCCGVHCCASGYECQAGYCVVVYVNNQTQTLTETYTYSETIQANVTVTVTTTEVAVETKACEDLDPKKCKPNKTTITLSVFFSIVASLLLCGICGGLWWKKRHPRPTPPPEVPPPTDSYTPEPPKGYGGGGEPPSEPPTTSYEPKPEPPSTGYEPKPPATGYQS